MKPVMNPAWGDQIPNPGSEEARAYGCTCAVIDNHYGKGFPGRNGEPEFWISGDCPIHGSKRSGTESSGPR